MNLPCFLNASARGIFSGNPSENVRFHITDRTSVDILHNLAYRMFVSAAVLHGFASFFPLKVPLSTRCIKPLSLRLP